MTERIPTELKLRTTSRLLVVTFDDGARFELPFAYLRTHSPSAEVQGHGPGQETLVTDKENVVIQAIEPVGQYAVRLVFDDGHASGLYTWKLLYQLGRDQQVNLDRYQQRVRAARGLETVPPRRTLTGSGPGMDPAVPGQDPKPGQ